MGLIFLNLFHFLILIGLRNLIFAYPNPGHVTNGHYYKSNYCSAADNFYKNMVTLTGALNGKVINVGIDSIHQRDVFFMNVSANGYPNGGFM